MREGMEGGKGSGKSDGQNTCVRTSVFESRIVLIASTSREGKREHDKLYIRWHTQTAMQQSSVNEQRPTCSSSVPFVLSIASKAVSSFITSGELLGGVDKKGRGGAGFGG